MRRLLWLGILSGLFAGCGDPPVPTGAAAEATTPEIIISTESPTEGASATSSAAPATQLAKVDVEVPGMT